MRNKTTILTPSYTDTSAKAKAYLKSPANSTRT
nr:MAG TPA: hypothetical protein [Caudoviricetes sp.]